MAADVEIAGVLARYCQFQAAIKNNGTEPWWWGGRVTTWTPAIVGCDIWDGRECVNPYLTQIGYWYTVADTWVFNLVPIALRAKRVVTHPAYWVAVVVIASVVWAWRRWGRQGSR